jgi:hypothetical protein
MGWSINYNTKDGFIELTYFDRVSKNDLLKAFQGAEKLVWEHKTKLILSDCTKMKGGHTLFDLFGLIEELGKADMLRTIKEAVLLSSSAESAANIEFWETACVNRGYNVKIFEDAEKAIGWLKS